MQHVALLVNPAAGRGRAARIGTVVATTLRGHGLTVTEIDDPADHADVEVLVVVGGDGTVHRALPALCGTPTALAVIPAGSGNDLATDLGVPADPRRAADLVAVGTTRSLDVGWVAGRPFATVLCTGFDAAVAARAARLRWPRGPRRYDVAVVAEVARLRSRPLRLELDGETVERPITLVAVGNTTRYGGGLRICPDADPADGLLDVTVVGPVTRRELLRVAPTLRTGRHVDRPAVTRHRAAVITLHGADEPAYADGEPVGSLPLDITVRAGALRVVVPT